MPTMFAHGVEEVEVTLPNRSITSRDGRGATVADVLRLRTATPADADVFAGTVAEGFASYRAFAPAQWRSPDRLEFALAIGVRLTEPVVRAWLAERDGEPAGHLTWLPADRSRHAADDPALAHLEQLFVRTAHWGTGVADALLGRGLEEAAEAGFTAIRLFTPAGQGRARRFYEREDFTPRGEPWLEPALGLELLEYRRALPRSPGAA
jgi:GNAT superfamily N-acetyltransferase